MSHRPPRGRLRGSVLAGLLAIVSVGWAGEGRSNAAAPAELISVNPSGGGALASDDFDPSVSGDGNIVVFSSNDFVGNTYFEDVWVRNRVAGSTTHVPQPNLGPFGSLARTTRGALSRDGCHVVFWGLYYFDFPAGEWNIYTWNRCVGGSIPVEIAGGVLPPSAFPPELAVSADGRYVAYTAQPSSGPPKVARIDTNTSTENVLLIPFISVNSIDISDDGKFVAIGGQRNTAGVTSNQVLGWTAPCGNACTVEVVSVNDAGQTASGFSSSPSVSADGRYVAFRSDGPELAGLPAGGPDQLYVRDRAAKITRLVTDVAGQPIQAGAVFVSDPDLTPDGSQVAVTLNDRFENSQVWVARSTSGFYTTSALDLVSFGVDDQPVPQGAYGASMSSNGRNVAFASNSSAALSGGTLADFQYEVWLRVRPIALDVTPTLNFGTVDVGQQSAPQNAVVVNTSGVPINISGVTSPAAPFSITGNGCSGTLPPGASCAVTVVFSPTVAGPATSSITISGDGLSVSVSLVGTGRAPEGSLIINPASVNFGTAPVGTTLPARNLVVSNPGQLAVPFSDVSLSGGDADQFAIASNGCTGSLAGGASCTITVTSTPTRTGALTGILSVRGTGGQVAQATLRVRGTGVTIVFTPTLKMNPGVVSPGEVTTAIGAGFPPGIEVQVAFEGESPFATVTTDGAGEFHVQYLLLRNGIRIGGRQIVVTSPAEFTDVRAPLLIDLATFRPSGFSSPAITSGVRSLVSRNG